MKKEFKTKGTKEWADKNINFQQGCSNNCLYCYAKCMALQYKRIKNESEWKNEIFNQKAINKTMFKHVGFRYMFPSTHDITINNFIPAIQMIKNITACENEILITSKPNLKTIEAICDYFNTIPEMNFRTMGMENAQMIDLRRVNAKAYIQFRFTITTIGDSMRRIWEENAPTFEERLSCLKYAYGKGYKTSISIEPYLENPSLIIKEVEPYTTESIWVGIMNKSKLTPMAKEVYQNQNLGNLLYSKEFIKEHLDSWITLAKGKLRLKDSIQNMLGVDLYGRFSQTEKGK